MHTAFATKISIRVSKIAKFDIGNAVRASSTFDAFCLHKKYHILSKAGVGKLRPAGQMRPFKSILAARELLFSRKLAL